MKVLITGYTGYVGRNLKDFFPKDQVTLVNRKNCNLQKRSNLRKIKNKFDVIYHFASWMKAGEFAKKNRGKILKKNNLINKNFFTWWKNFQPQAFLICLGSSCAYPNVKNLVEKKYLEGKPDISQREFGLSKRYQFSFLKRIAKKKLNYLYLIPSTLCGEKFDYNQKYCHFIFDIIRKILYAKKNKRKVTIWGDGFQKREITYVGDLIFFFCNYKLLPKNIFINISSSNGHIIRWYVRIICDYLNFDSKNVVYDASRYVGVKNKTLNNSFLKKSIPEFVFTNDIKAIHKTIEYEKFFYNINS